MRTPEETSCAIDLIAAGFADPSTIRAVREIRLGAGLIRVLISGSASDGRLELFEFRVPPGQPGPGLHTHEGAEECFTILEGSAAFRIGAADRRTSAGDSLVVPRRVPHSWHVVGEATLRMLVTFAPSIAMEAYFVELGELVADGGSPSVEQMRSLWGKYDTRPARL